MEQSLLIKIFEILIFAFPSIVTILVLLNRNFYIKELQSINTKIDILDTNNKTRTDQILERVQFHQMIIKKMMTYKTASQKIHELTKHAIQYVGDRRLSKIMENSTQQFINFLIPILKQGLTNISKEQLLAKINLNRDNSLSYVKNTLTAHQYEIWKPMAATIVNPYIDSIFDIYNDPINDKNSRFFIKSQDYVQNLVRQLIKFAALIKYHEIGEVNEK